VSGTFGIFGLWVHCDCALPAMAAATPPPHDVDVRLGDWPAHPPAFPAQPWYLSNYLDEQGRPALSVRRSTDGRWFLWAYTDGMRFLIQDARQVWCAWPDSLSREDALTYLLGPVLGFLLVQRGVVCLHAGAVEVNGRAVLLVGPAGSGKSTTTAALARLGHPVISDDIAALRLSGGRVMVLPGPRQVRLWPPSVGMLFGRDDCLPVLTPTWNKRGLHPENGARFSDGPVPLHAIYLLQPRGRRADLPRASPAAGHECMIDLAANIYGTLLRQAAHRAVEFDMLSRLCRDVRVARLTPHADPLHLSDLCRCILDDLECRLPARSPRRVGCRV